MVLPKNCRGSIFPELSPSNSRRIYRQAHRDKRAAILLLFRVFNAAGTCLSVRCLALTGGIQPPCQLQGLHGIQGTSKEDLSITPSKNLHSSPQHIQTSNIQQGVTYAQMTKPKSFASPLKLGMTPVLICLLRSFFRYNNNKVVTFRSSKP
jgi:hypothetical protein